MKCIVLLITYLHWLQDPVNRAAIIEAFEFPSTSAGAAAAVHAGREPGDWPAVATQIVDEMSRQRSGNLDKAAMEVSKQLVKVVIANTGHSKVLTEDPKLLSTFFDQIKAGAKANLDANSQELHADAIERGVARAPKHQFMNFEMVMNEFAHLVPLLSKGGSLTEKELTQMAIGVILHSKFIDGLLNAKLSSKIFREFAKFLKHPDIKGLARMLAKIIAEYGGDSNRCVALWKCTAPVAVCVHDCTCRGCLNKHVMAQFTSCRALAVTRPTQFLHFGDPR